MKGFRAFQVFNSMSHMILTNYNYDPLKYNFGFRGCSPQNFQKDKSRWQYGGLEQGDNLLYRVFTCYELAWIDSSMQRKKKTLYGAVPNLSGLLRLHSRLSDKDPKVFVEDCFKKDLQSIISEYTTITQAIHTNGDVFPALYEKYADGEISLKSLLLIIALYDSEGIMFDEKRSKDTIRFPFMVKACRVLVQFMPLLFDYNDLKELV